MGEREGRRKQGGTEHPTPCSPLPHKHINAHSPSKPSGFNRRPITLRDDIWGTTADK